MKSLGSRGGPAALAAHGLRHQRLAGLARLLTAGIPPDRALEMLAAEPDRTQRQLAQAAREVRRGVAAPVALATAGLVTQAERAVLEAFATIGRLDLGVDDIARDLERDAELVATVKARLVLPAAVLVIGALSAPLPALVRGDLSRTGFALEAAMPVMLLLTAFVLAVRLPWRWPAAVVEALRRRRGLAPSDFVRRRIYAVLGRTLAAGLDAASALEVARTAAPGGWSGALSRAASRVAGGGTIVAALVAPDIGITPARERALLASAEAAGALPDALARRVRALDAARAQRARGIAAWVPRMAYVLVTGWVLAGLF